MPIAAGIALLAISAAMLVAVALRHNTKPSTDPAADALTACRAFDDVYAATKPGTPLDSNVLAEKLQLAIERMRRAASADGKWKTLASSLADTGAAVNAGDAPSAYAGMVAVHRSCASVLSKTF